MSEVHVKEGESLDSALKRLREAAPRQASWLKCGERECYESPSVKRRKKSEAARKNRNKRYYNRLKKRAGRCVQHAFTDSGDNAPFGGVILTGGPACRCICEVGGIKCHCS